MVHKVTLINRGDDVPERLHNVIIGVVDDVSALPPTYDVDNDASEVEIEMSGICGYIDGTVGSQGTVSCPEGVYGAYLVVQILDTYSQCPSYLPVTEDQNGCLLTLCEVFAETNGGETYIATSVKG